MKELNDVEMIIALQEKGPSYINTLLKNKKNKSKTKKILSFEKLYITDKELFEDGIMKYVEYLKNNDSLLFLSLIQTLTDKEIIKYLTKITKYIEYSSYTEADRFEFLKKVITEPKITNLLRNETNVWSLLIGPLLSVFSVTSPAWQTNIKTLHAIIKPLLINDKLMENNFVKWVSFVTNICISKINIDIENHNTNLPTDYCLANLLGLVISFWNDEATPSSIKTIDYDFIISDKSTIKWLDKKITNDTKEYNFLTKCTFLILNTIRVGYVPILYRSLKWSKLLETIEEQLDNFNFNNPLSVLIVRNLKMQKSIISDYIQIDNEIMKNSCLNTWVNTFYITFSTWITLNKTKQIDDILVDLIFFLIHINRIENFKYKSDTYNFILNIVESKDYTSSIDIKCEFMKLFSDVLVNNISYIRNAKCIEKIMSRYSFGMILLYNELHDSRMIAEYKFMNKVKIYNSMEENFFNSKFKSILIQNLSKDAFATKKFINTLLTDVSDISDTIDEMYTKLNDEDDDPDDYEIEELVMGIASVFDFNCNLILFFNKLLNVIISNQTLKTLVFSKEIISTLTMIVNLLINKLYTQIQYSADLCLDDYCSDVSIEVEFDKYTEALSDILKIIYNTDFDIKSIIENHFFDLDYYVEFNVYVENKIDDIINELRNEIANKSNLSNLSEITPPDEFIDQITYTLIQTPCMIPDIDMHFDKSTIVKQLLTKEENPFTRAKLTMQEFDSYNELDSVKGKNELLLNNINNWKNNNTL